MVVQIIMSTGRWEWCQLLIVEPELAFVFFFHRLFGVSLTILGFEPGYLPPYSKEVPLKHLSTGPMPHWLS